jgi:hypothetical protein
VGVLNEFDGERLLFVTDAEAAAYSCLAWDRFNSGIEANNNYFVCNIGYTTCSFSKIIAHTTETKSKVYYVNGEIGGSSTIVQDYERELNNTTTDKEKIISLMLELPERLRRVKEKKVLRKEIYSSLKKSLHLALRMKRTSIIRPRMI